MEGASPLRRYWPQTPVACGATPVACGATPFVKGGVANTRLPPVRGLNRRPRNARLGGDYRGAGEHSSPLQWKPVIDRATGAVAPTCTGVARYAPPG